MAGLAPPPNAANIPPPAIPGIPPLLSDISNAYEYLTSLTLSKISGSLTGATPDDIGAAAAYTVGLVMSNDPDGHVAPAWLAHFTANINQQFNQVTAAIQQVTAVIQQNHDQLQGNINQLQDDVAFIRQRLIEQPILLANSQAGDYGPLLNPVTIQANGSAQPLTAPNPTSREELIQFTAQQCMASAQNLGLPALPVNTPILDRRRQIAHRIGVIIH